MQPILNCGDISEAHKLSALSFGIFKPRHIRGGTVRKTESINSGIYEEDPFYYLIKPRIRYYKERNERSSIVDFSSRKAAALEKILETRQEEKKIMEAYIQNRRIDFENLPVIAPHVRLTLLEWLSKGMHGADRKGKTEEGRIFTVIPPADKLAKCTLHCEDGSLDMPPYVIELESEILG